MKRYKLQFAKTVTEDSYEHGEIGKTHDFGFYDTITVKTIDEIKEHIPKDASIFDSRIDWQRLENADGYEATEKQIEFWKQGGQILYAVTYSLYISEIVSINVDNEKLATMFPLLENQGVY